MEKNGHCEEGGGVVDDEEELHKVQIQQNVEEKQVNDKENYGDDNYGVEEK